MEHRKIVNYAIVSRDSQTQITTAVKSWIESGWEPLGGICSTMTNGYREYSQAVVRYEANNE